MINLAARIVAAVVAIGRAVKIAVLVRNAA